MTAPTTTPAAETVAAVLDAFPMGVTVRDLAAHAGVGQSTTAKILAALETAGTAVRTPGPANGNRKTADIWHPTTTGAPTDEAPADDTAAVSEPSTGDAAPGDVTTPADATSIDGAPADDTDPVFEPTTDDITRADAAAVAPVSGASSGNPDHFKIVMVAGVLGGYPDGVSVADVIDQSGLRAAVVAGVLTAMEVAGAAVRKPGDRDGAPQLWVRGDADLSTVDMANAAPYRECVCTCGHQHRVKTGVAVSGRRTGTRTTGEVNTDGSVKLAKNGLRNQVEAFMRDLGAGHDVTPGTIGKELGGRSSGAVLNAMGRLSAAGVLVMTNEAPVMYALTDDAPAPADEVAALMTRPVVTDTRADDATTTDTAENTANSGTANTLPADTALVAA